MNTRKVFTQLEVGKGGVMDKVCCPRNDEWHHLLLADDHLLKDVHQQRDGQEQNLDVRLSVQQFPLKKADKQGEGFAGDVGTQGGQDSLDDEMDGVGDPDDGEYIRRQDGGQGLKAFHPHGYYKKKIIILKYNLSTYKQNNFI